MAAQTQTHTHHAILMPGDESAVGGPVVVEHTASIFTYDSAPLQLCVEGGRVCNVQGLGR